MNYFVSNDKLDENLSREIEELIFFSGDAGI
jgi:hypothetical protein